MSCLPPNQAWGGGRWGRGAKLGGGGFGRQAALGLPVGASLHVCVWRVGDFTTRPGTTIPFMLITGRGTLYGAQQIISMWMDIKMGLTHQATLGKSPLPSASASSSVGWTQGIPHILQGYRPNRPLLPQLILGPEVVCRYSSALLGKPGSSCI